MTARARRSLTYPRAEVRCLPESAIADAPKIVAGLQVGKSYSAISVPSPPAIRKGRNGSFHDKGREGASHHAVIPNVNTIEDLGDIWPRLSGEEKKLFEAVAQSYLASVMPDYRYGQTTVTLDVCGFEFRAAGGQTIEPGWCDAFPNWRRRCCRCSATSRPRGCSNRRSRTRRPGLRRATRRER